MATPVGARLAAAVRATYEEAGVSQVDLADRLGVDQTTISTWARGMRRTPLDVLPDIEAACGVKRGTILRRAGYVDDGPADVIGAINSDVTLDERGKRVLTAMYQELKRSASPATTLETLPRDLTKLS